MKRIEIRSLVLGTLLGAVVTLSVAAATVGGSRTVWEYKVVPGDVTGGLLEKAINNSASEGWELISTSPLTGFYGFAVLRREKK